MIRAELKDLTDDGDTVEIDGRTFRLRIEPDDCGGGFPSDHGDCYGKFAWVENDRYGEHDHRERPEGFTGNAEILRPYRGDAIWWEPYDMHRDDPQFSAYRRNVLDILEYGWLSVGLEELGPEDYYGRPAVLNASWIGGIEPDPGDYLHDIVADLYDELTYERTPA